MWLNFLQLGSARLKTSKSTSVSRLRKLDPVVQSPRSMYEYIPRSSAPKGESIGRVAREVVTKNKNTNILSIDTYPESRSGESWKPLIIIVARPHSASTGIFPSDQRLCRSSDPGSRVPECL